MRFRLSMFRPPASAQPQTSSRHTLRVAGTAAPVQRSRGHHIKALRQRSLISSTAFPCEHAQQSKQACRATAGKGALDSLEAGNPSQFQQDSFSLTVHPSPPVPWGWGTIFKVCSCPKPSLAATCICCFLYSNHWPHAQVPFTLLV